MAERAALLRAEQLARWWRERVRETFLKKGCDLELHAAVAGNGHYDLLGEDGEWSASLACSYCTGNDPAETSQFMVGCDTCERWYHGPCVSMSKAAADAVDTYLCPECAKLANLQYAFGPPAPAAAAAGVDAARRGGRDRRRDARGGDDQGAAGAGGHVAGACQGGAGARHGGRHTARRRHARGAAGRGRRVRGRARVARAAAPLAGARARHARGAHRCARAAQAV